MKRAVVNLAKEMLGASGREFVLTGVLADLREKARQADKAQRLGMVPGERMHEAVALLPQSQSQLNQDFFALEAIGWKRDGYFVEFGATDGKLFSNSYLLEKAFGWTGILAEPGKNWRAGLAASDRTAIKDYRCVWSASGETLEFQEARWGEMSTLSTFAARDQHDRSDSRTYSVETISLTDLLEAHDAPPTIDYLSIDTEGSEFAILEAYDFASRPIRSISVEHNHTADRERIHALLTGKGYERRYEQFSDCDDWYVLRG